MYTLCVIVLGAASAHSLLSFMNALLVIYSLLGGRCRCALDSSGACSTLSSVVFGVSWLYSSKTRILFGAQPRGDCGVGSVVAGGSSKVEFSQCRASQPFRQLRRCSTGRRLLFQCPSPNPPLGDSRLSLGTPTSRNIPCRPVPQRVPTAQEQMVELRARAAGAEEDLARVLDARDRHVSTGAGTQLQAPRGGLPSMFSDSSDPGRLRELPLPSLLQPPATASQHPPQSFIPITNCYTCSDAPTQGITSSPFCHQDHMMILALALVTGISGEHRGPSSILLAAQAPPQSSEAPQREKNFYVSGVRP